MGNENENFQALDRALGKFFNPLGGKEYTYALNASVTTVGAGPNYNLVSPPNTMLLPKTLKMTANIGEGNAVFLSPKAINPFPSYVYPQDCIVLRDAETTCVQRNAFITHFLSCIHVYRGVATMQQNVPPVLRGSENLDYEVTSPTYPSHFRILATDPITPDVVMVFIRNWEKMPIRVRLTSDGGAPFANLLSGKLRFLQMQTFGNNIPEYIGNPAVGADDYPVAGGIIDFVLPPSHYAYVTLSWLHANIQPVLVQVHRAPHIVVRHHLILSPLMVRNYTLIADTPTNPALVTDGVAIGDADVVQTCYVKQIATFEICPTFVSSHQIELFWLINADAPAWHETLWESNFAIGAFPLDHWAITSTNTISRAKPPNGAYRVYYRNRASVPTEALYAKTYVLRLEHEENRMSP